MPVNSGMELYEELSRVLEGVNVVNVEYYEPEDGVFIERVKYGLLFSVRALTTIGDYLVNYIAMIEIYIARNRYIELRMYDSHGTHVATFEVDGKDWEVELKRDYRGNPLGIVISCEGRDIIINF